MGNTHTFRERLVAGIIVAGLFFNVFALPASVTASVLVDRVHVSPEPATVQVGSTLQLSAEARDIANDPLVPQPSVSWSMQNNDTTLGTVDSNGLFTATAAGLAHVVATMDGVEGIADITVTAAPGTDTTAPVVTLIGADPMNLTVGGTYTEPGATALDETDGDVSASIAITGTVDTATAGTYTLTYSAHDAAGNIGTATRIVVVSAPAATVDRVHVSPEPATVQVGSTLQLSAEARDIANDPLVPQPSVSWSMQNNDTTLGTVDSNGLFTATAAGLAHVVATMDGVEGIADITVTAAPNLASIAVSPAMLRLNRGTTYRFTADARDQFGNAYNAAVAWSSSNTTVGTIDQTGLFNALAAGSTVITVSSGAVSDTADVTVTVPQATQQLTSIVIAPASLNITVGGTQQFTAQAFDQSDVLMSPQPAITWSSSNITVGTISGSGSFEALAEGSTDITAASGSVTRTVRVNVQAVANGAPVIDQLSPRTARIGRLFETTVDAEDPDGDTITFSLASSPQDAVIDPVTGKISWMPGSAGTYTMDIRATDTFGNRDTKTLEITVLSGSVRAVGGRGSRSSSSGSSSQGSGSGGGSSSGSSAPSSAPSSSTTNKPSGDTDTKGNDAADNNDKSGSGEKDGSSASGSSGTSSQTSVTAKTLQYGDRGEDVRKLQAKLRLEGLLKVEPTGYFGELTRTALQAFQEKKGLARTGLADATTQAHLSGSGTAKTSLTAQMSNSQIGTILDQLMTKVMDLMGKVGKMKF